MPDPEFLSYAYISSRGSAGGIASVTVTAQHQGTTVRFCQRATAAPQAGCHRRKQWWASISAGSRRARQLVLAVCTGVSPAWPLPGGREWVGASRNCVAQGGHPLYSHRAVAQQIMGLLRVLRWRLRPGGELALQADLVVGQPGLRTTSQQGQQGRLSHCALS